MLKIIGSEVWRGGEKIGWLEGEHVRGHGGQKLGYFQSNFVYNAEGHKIAYIEGDHLFSGSNKISLSTVSQSIEGGVLPEIGRCAVYVLLGS